MFNAWPVTLAAVKMHVWLPSEVTLIIASKLSGLVAFDPAIVTGTP